MILFFWCAIFIAFVCERVKITLWTGQPNTLLECGAKYLFDDIHLVYSYNSTKQMPHCVYVLNR